MVNGFFAGIEVLNYRNGYDHVKKIILLHAGRLCGGNNFRQDKETGASRSFGVRNFLVK